MSIRKLHLVGGIALTAMPFFFGVGGAAGAGMYDGTYHGTLTGGAMNRPTCARSAPAQMTVTNDQLEYHHLGNSLITAPVSADGSFSGTAQNNYTNGGAAPLSQTLTGRISGGMIQAETKVGNYCTYTLSLKRF